MFGLGKKKEKLGVGKVKLTIDGMHCVACSMNIDGELEEIPGVLSASTSYAKGECIVEYSASEADVSSFLKTIEKLGYKARINQE